MVALENVLRADEPRPSLERDQLSPTPPTPSTARSGSRRPAPRERRVHSRSHRRERARPRSRRAARRRLSTERRSTALARRSERRTVGSRGGARPPGTARWQEFPSPSRTSSAPRACPTTAGSKILEGYRPAVHGYRCRSAGSRRRERPRQDEHGRVRDGLLERELRLRRRPQPVGPRARAGRQLRRLRCGRRRRPRAVRDRHRHRRLDPPARLALRNRRPQAHLRRGLALRDDRLRLVARPVRNAHPRRHGRGAAHPRAGGARPARLHLDRHPGGIELPSGERPAGPSVRRRARLLRRGRGRRA